MRVNPSTLIFGQVSDAHVQSVLSLLDPDTIPLVVDLSKFGKQFVATYENGKNGIEVLIKDRNGNLFSLNSVLKVWWRRPQPLVPSDLLDEVSRQFAAEEFRCFGGGSFQRLTMLVGSIILIVTEN